MRLLILVFILMLFSSLGFAQPTKKAEIAKLQKEIARLEVKLEKRISTATKKKVRDLIEGHQARLDKLQENLTETTPAPEVDGSTQIKNKIVKIQAEITRLEKKLETKVGAVRKSKLRELIKGHQARVAKLEEDLKETSEPEEVLLPEPTTFQPRFKFEMGSIAGVLAGATGGSGEIRFPLHFIFGPATSSLRLALGYAQSEDSSRRYIPLQLDGVLNFPPGAITGVENYLGAGLNYVLLTSGGVSGTIGGEVFYGVESDGFGGKLFGEMGYAILRTGFSASHRGVSVLIGYRREWAF